MPNPDIPPASRSPRPELVVVGASAGGVEALMALASSLPSGFPVPVCIVLHMASNGVSTLPRILGRAGLNPAVQVQDRVPLHPGTLYVAQPDRHLVVEPGYARSVMAPRENRHRPSVDPLFRSAAAAYGPGVVGVVLTGSGDDGAAGLLTIRRRGGITIVQDPDEAFAAGMPGRALEVEAADYCVPLRDLGRLLCHLTGLAEEPEFASASRVGHRRSECEMRERQDAAELLADHAEEAAVAEAPDAAPLSGFTCPECGGRIWELEEEGLLRFRCRVGHGYSTSSFLSTHTEALEGALWAAINALEENASLNRRLAERAEERRHALTAKRLAQKAADTSHQAKLLRELLERSHAADPVLLETPGASGREAMDGAPLHVHAMGEAASA